MVMMNQNPKKLKILYKRHISKYSKPTEKKDNKPKTIIYQGFDEATFEIIAFAETSKEI
jgi:hypothetical protein